MVTFVRGGLRFLPVVLLTLGLATDLSAQTGSIAGAVIDEATRRPLASVQVFIPGTGLGALTNADGRYLLNNVPVGQRTLRAQMIGFTQVDQTVTVAAAGSATANFGLRQSAIALGEIVVTGLGAATER